MTTERPNREPLRVAVAGVGSFSQRVLIPGLVDCPDAEVVAVYGPTPAKTQQIAQQRGIPRAYSDYEQMLDQARPQAVVVATPNDVHHPMALVAIRRGLAVFCEKPLAVSLAQAEELAAAARSAGVPTAVNFTYRSTNGTRHVERLIRQGCVGDLYHFSISFWQNIRADPRVPLGYRMLRERGGGALLDIGVHMMDVLSWWFGDLAAVCGLIRTAIPERPTPDGGRGAVTADDTASFIVRLAGGAAGTVQVSQVAIGRQNYRRFEVFGSDGSVTMEEDRSFGPEVRVAGPGDTAFAVQPIPDDLNVAFDDFPRFHLSRVVAALRGDSTDWPTFEDGLRAQRAIAAVEESMQTGRWVGVR
ncbi:MAG: Gfo/Idh/MocA family protein [Chloroflexota bacterium]